MCDILDISYGCFCHDWQFLQRGDILGFDKHRHPSWHVGQSWWMSLSTSRFAELGAHCRYSPLFDGLVWYCVEYSGRNVTMLDGSYDYGSRWKLKFWLLPVWRRTRLYVEKRMHLNAYFWYLSKVKKNTENLHKFLKKIVKQHNTAGFN